MGKVMLEGFECERCGHKWIPRATTEDTPTICPKCKSPYWDKPRRSKTILNKEIPVSDVKEDRIKEETVSE